MTDKPDVSKLRVGDIVHVRGIVTDVSCGHPSVRFGGPGALNIAVAPADIVSVEPRPLKVGDRVRCPFGVLHEIQAIASGNALTVSVGSGEPVGFRLSDLSPA